MTIVYLILPLLTLKVYLETLLELSLLNLIVLKVLETCCYLNFCILSMSWTFSLIWFIRLWFVKPISYMQVISLICKCIILDWWFIRPDLEVSLFTIFILNFLFIDFLSLVLTDFNLISISFEMVTCSRKAKLTQIIIGFNCGN